MNEISPAFAVYLNLWSVHVRERELVTEKQWVSKLYVTLSTPLSMYINVLCVLCVSAAVGEIGTSLTWEYQTM